MGTKIENQMVTKMTPKATAQMGGLTREEIEVMRTNVKGAVTNLWADASGRRIMHDKVDALCDLVLHAIDRWVPVSERLPERGVVLAVTADGQIDMYQWNLVADYANDPDPNARITHWQPLPPPPERP